MTRLVVPPTDTRLTPAVLATERALRWYIGEVPHAQKPPVSLAEAEALYALLAAQSPRESAHFGQLVSFARTMYRIGQLDAAAPQCNLGDALTALSAVPQPDEPAWVFDRAIDGEAFAKLGFRETSTGIGKTQRDNREGWWAHAQKNRAFIEEAARHTTHKRLAVVLGAGAAFDLPLVELARAFERLLVVDVDAQALESTVAGVFKDPGLRAKVEARVIDLTGVNGQLVARLDEIAAASGSAAEIHDRIERLCQTYRLAAAPRLLEDGERADLLVSSCVLSQVAWPQRIYGARLYEKRFGALRGAAEQRWSRHWSELELRMQQDHLTSLAGTAQVVALTSDVVSNVTVLDAAGTERKSGHTIFALGAPALAERIPKLFSVEAEQRWEWGRYRATQKGQGSRMDVDGARLVEPHGLVIP
jgi:hypothetical protein